jgi:hypothetical protein
MKVKTSELTGKALDYAVCLAKGLKLTKYRGVWAVEIPTEHAEPFYGVIPPCSSNWAYGGPLIERETLDVDFVEGQEPNFCSL